MLYKRQLQPRSNPVSSVMPVTMDEAYETDLLARTLWGEARGEGLAGIEAVANVILNRAKISRKKGRFWWGDSITEICLKPMQFSCWNLDDVNQKKLLTVTTSDPGFAVCQRIARRAINGLLQDNTNGADHYHADTVTPRWADGRVPVADIGHHFFYRLEE